MTNTQYLEQKIEDSGLKKTYIADQLGLSRQGLYLKMNNLNEFTASEIKNMCLLLGITSLKEKERIFFVAKV